MTISFPDHDLKEIAIANLGPFVILVPTDTIYLLNGKNTLGFPIPRRIYRKTGWAFDPYSGTIRGIIQGLQVTSSSPDGMPFIQDQRLVQGAPLSFELRSSMPFSKAIANLALFQYQFQEALPFYYGMFQNLKPSFVRIYPFRSPQQFPGQVARFSHEELHMKLQQQFRWENENNLT